MCSKGYEYYLSETIPDFIIVVCLDDACCHANPCTTILGDPALPLEVSYGVLFLASDEPYLMSVSEMVVDGDYTAS